MHQKHSSKILITTSRNPTQIMRTFCNDLAHTIPHTIRINRGKSSLTTLAEKALEHGAEKIVIADRWKGNLGKIQLFEINDTGLTRYYPLIYVKNVRLRRTFGRKPSKATKCLTLQTDFEIPFEAQKLGNALANFLNIRKKSIEETCAPSTQTAMHISLKTTHHIQITFMQTPQKIEIGPRITISHLIWKP